MYEKKFHSKILVKVCHNFKKLLGQIFFSIIECGHLLGRYNQDLRTERYEKNIQIVVFFMVVVLFFNIYFVEKLIKNALQLWILLLWA